MVGWGEVSVSVVGSGPSYGAKVGVDTVASRGAQERHRTVRCAAIPLRKGRIGRVDEKASSGVEYPFLHDPAHQMNTVRTGTDYRKIDDTRL